MIKSFVASWLDIRISWKSLACSIIRKLELWDSTDDSKDKRLTCSNNKEEEARPEVLIESCSSSETFLTGRASGRLDLDLQFPRFLTDSEGWEKQDEKGITPLR